jgi:hypothetical protein
MNKSFFDFLRAPSVPEVVSQIAACSSSDIQIPSVLVSAVRTYPVQVIVENDFSVESAFLTVV